MAMFKQNHVVVVTYAEIEQKLRETGIVDKEGGEKDGK